MKRPLRIMFNALTVLSLLLCFATIALWARSYWQAQFIGYLCPGGWVGVLSMGGLLRVEHGNYSDDGRRRWGRDSYPTPRDGLWNEVRARERLICVG